MRCSIWIFLLICGGLLGCSGSTTDVATSTPEGTAADDGADSADASPRSPTPPAGAAPRPASSGQPVPIENGVVTLTPDNTVIQFVGTHVGDNPDPRTGRFEKLTGSMQVDTESQSLRSIAVVIETESLTTDIDRLTTHLRSPDFFDTREYPTAEFKSTSIAKSSEGENRFDVTGMLLLHGVTKEITFPATVTIADNTLTMLSQFTIDRSQFEMTYGPDRVEKSVALTIAVGQRIEGETQARGPGEGRRGPGGGGFDPAQMFARSDADGDGKLAGDEIPERMRENLAQIDADGDGAVTQEEFQERMRQMRAERGQN